MNINQNIFNDAPTVSAPRSTFYFKKPVRTTFNMGLLIPVVQYNKVVPGDTFEITGSIVLRTTSAFVHPIMDNLEATLYGFFTPNRIVWEHWRNHLGENTAGAWAPAVTYTVPQTKLKYFSSGYVTSVKHGDILNYMGIPLYTPASGQEVSISQLPLRAYVFVWNEYFRNAALQAPAWMPTNDTTYNVIQDSYRGNASYDGWLKTNINTATVFNCHPAPVNKAADYFTTCHVQPQYGTAVVLPIGQSAPVIFDSADTFGTVDQATIKFKHSTDGSAAAYNNNLIGINPTSVLDAYSGNTGSGSLGADFTFANKIYADLSNAVAATIIAQRIAFQTQKIAEAMTNGSRWREIIRNFFGVNVGDSTAQIPEFLFAKKIPITLSEVTQTSSTDSVTPQGNQAAFSITTNVDHLITKSFVEHGMLQFFIVVRQTEHSYSQGIDRSWFYENTLDWFWPQLQCVGEQSVRNEEIFVQGTSQDKEIWGYQERYAEYKWENPLNTGLFSPQAPGTLASWHLGDNYGSLPVLQSDWSLETPVYLDRALVVPSTTADQFLLDSCFYFKATRCMMLHSKPGLVDHF